MEKSSESHSMTKYWIVIPLALLFVSISVIRMFLFNVLYGVTVIAFVRIMWEVFKMVSEKFHPRKRISPEDKIVFITGCDSGFGNGLARRLHGEGYTVVAGCLSPEGEGARSLRAQFSADRMHVIGLDVTKESDVSKAVQEVKSILTANKKLWAIVNNAGMAVVAPWALTGIDDHEKQIAVNQLGVIRVTRAFLPLLLQSQGRIVIVASFAGHVAFPCLVTYSMTKHAVIALADGLRRELGNQKVKVLTIEPNFYRTNIIPNSADVSAYLEKMWENSDPEIRHLYPQPHLQRISRQTSKFQKIANPNVDEVLDAMMDSVTLENPDISRKVSFLFERVGLWFYQMSPIFVQDIIVRCVQSR